MKPIEILLALVILLAIALAATYVLPELVREFPGAVRQAQFAVSFTLSWLRQVGNGIPPDAKLVTVIILIVGLFYIFFGYMLGAFTGIKRF